MATITRQDFEQRAKNLPKGMTKAGLARSLLNQGYELEGLQVPATKVQEVAERGDQPGFLRQFIDVVTAPADLAAGGVQLGLSKLAGVAGLKKMEEFISSTKDVREIGENYRQTLGVAPLYGAVIGAGVGAPGVGAAAGQALQEAGLAGLGENQNTPLQAAGNIALSGVAGKIAGGGKSILGIAGRSALGEGIIQGGRDVMGNNPLSEGEQAQAIGMAGMFGAGAATLGKIAPSTIQGGVSGGVSGASKGFLSGAKSAADDVLSPFVRGQRKFVKVLGFKLSPLDPTPELDNAIKNVVNQSIRPSKGEKGPTSFTQNRYDDNAVKAMKDIAANRDKLTFIGREGEEIVGSSPQSISQLQAANDQMLKGIAKRMNALHEFATRKGLSIAGDNVADELEKFANTKTIQTRNPKLASKARTLAASYRAKTFTPDEAQEMIAQANNELLAFNKNPNPNDVGGSVLTSLEKNVLDKSLNGAIMEVADSNPVFKELKRSYAAQKTLQTTVNNRLTTYLRQNPIGLIDYSSIYTADSAAQALLTMNPVAAGSTILQTALRAFIKFKNNPDNMIKGVFKTMDDYDFGSPILKNADDALGKLPITSQKVDIRDSAKSVMNPEMPDKIVIPGEPASTITPPQPNFTPGGQSIDDLAKQSGGVDNIPLDKLDDVEAARVRELDSVTKSLESEVKYGMKNVKRTPAQQAEIDASLAKANVERYGTLNPNHIPPDSVGIRVQTNKKGLQQDILFDKRTGKDVAPIATQAEKQQLLKEGYQPSAYDSSGLPAKSSDTLAPLMKEGKAIPKELEPLAKEARGIGGFTPSEMASRKRSFISYVTSDIRSPTALQDKIGTIVANTPTFEDALVKAKSIKSWKNAEVRKAIESDLKVFYDYQAVKDLPF